MPTQVEEQQARDFLKRAEIRTMKKDLQALREVDALKERDKIAKIKTLEEQEAEHAKKLAEIEEARITEEKNQVKQVLEKHETEERLAEKDLKEYATEQERQQIFLLESQRLSLENQADAIDKEKQPALKLEKNQILLKKKEWEDKLNKILEDEKKLEDQQKFITEKSQATAIPAERKSLEQSRWDLDKNIQEIEKKRWEAEKQIQDLDNKAKEIDQNSEKLVAERNDLRNKILGADKSLRDIYSAVIAKVEDKRRGKAEEQKKNQEELSKFKAGENERVQREQWRGKIPVPMKEEAQRQKFMQDVQQWADTGEVPKKK